MKRNKEASMGKENENEASLSEIIEKVSLKKKVKLLFGDGDWHTHGIQKTSIKSLEMHDGPCGLRKPYLGKPKPGEFVAASAASTCFPAPCLVACSWNPEVTKSIGERMALEALDQGTDIILAPGVNIKRNPLCGRNFEYLSEDPLLSGKMGAGFINGAQNQGVGTSLKHFAVNNQEYRRLNYSAEVDERALRDIYLKPFEIAIKESNPWTVMCSYNRINGVYASDNDFLLVTILRDEWGYQGVVMSDWGAAYDPVDSHNHGLDLEMPCHTDRTAQLMRASKSGKIPLNTIDLEATRIAGLSVKARIRKPSKTAFNYGMSHAAALEAAENSIVLAKNDNNILPLKNFQGCCLIGALAKTPRFQGSGSSQVVPKKLVSLLDAMNVGGDSKGIDFAPGYDLLSNKDSQKLCFDAVDLAASHKTVILMLGLPSEYESEGFDRHDMRLPEEQYSLADAVLKVNSNVIVVLTLGAPVELPFADRTKGIIIAYLAGEAGGEAIRNILLGKTNPSGKLAETWPLRYLDVPSYDFFPGNGDVSLYKESIYVGYRYYLTAKRAVRFPFGYGLSYSTFVYSDVAISKMVLSAGSELKISCNLTNTGPLLGSEVVELYLSPQNGKTFRPLRELRGFSKVSLASGDQKKIVFAIPFSSFSFFDIQRKKPVVEDGSYLIEIGSSCEDIRLSMVINVSSSFKGDDLQSRYPHYYSLPNDDVFRMSDNEFQNLLGHEIPSEIDHKKRPFTLNSTIEEISHTFIGKLIKKGVIKQMTLSTRSERANRDFITMVLDSPIRMSGVAGFHDKTLLAIVDMANGNYLKALGDVFFGHRK
jgi:beta-glucosidase